MPFKDHEALDARLLSFLLDVEQTPLTDRDKETYWYRFLDDTTGPSTEWESRDAYIRRCYMPHEAAALLKWAIDSGTVPVYSWYSGESLERLVPRIFFGQNRWEENSIRSGRYYPMNTAFDIDGPAREKKKDHLLYIADSDWDHACNAMLDRRRVLKGSFMPETGILAAKQLSNIWPPQNGNSLTLHEAVTWVATGDHDAVEEQRKVFARYLPTGEHAGSRAWISVNTLIAQQFCICGQKPIDCWCVDDAVKALKAACATGSVQSTGIAFGGSERALLEPAAFKQAELVPADLGSLIAEPRYGGATLFIDLRFDRDAVFRLLGERDKGPTTCKKRAFASRTEADNWYKDRVREADNAGFTWSRDEDYAAGAELGLKTERIEELRRLHTGHWPRSGRPKETVRQRKAAFLASKK